MEPAFGLLTSKDPRAPKPIYVVVERDERVSLYNQPPPFSVMKYIGEHGETCHLKRKKRGFLFSTFELTFTTEVEHDAIQYFTDNKFGDLLVLFITSKPSQ